MSKRVLIIGAGGHAQVVADALMQARSAGKPMEPVGYLDDCADLHGCVRLGIPVLGDLARRYTLHFDLLIIGIGDNQTRRRLFELFSREGRAFATVIHPTAVIGAEVIVGPGTLVCANAVINPGATIGANVILNTATVVEHHCRIGDHAHLAPGVRLGGEVQIGEGALLGVGAVSIPRRVIGDWSIVGAGAVITANLPPRTVAVGVPARVVKRIDDVVWR